MITGAKRRQHDYGSGEQERKRELLIFAEIDSREAASKYTGRATLWGQAKHVEMVRRGGGKSLEVISRSVR